MRSDLRSYETAVSEYGACAMVTQVLDLFRKVLPLTSFASHRRRSRKRLTSAPFAVSQILEARTMLTAPDIVYLLSGRVASGYYGHDVEPIDFNSGIDNEFDVSLSRATGYAAMQGSVTNYQDEGISRFTYDTQWNTHLVAENSLANPTPIAGISAAGALTVLVRGAGNTPYHLDVTIEVSAELDSSIWGYSQSIAQAPTWRGSDPDPVTGRYGAAVARYAADIGPLTDRYHVSINNTANNSYYEFADGNTDGMQLFGETYKVIWWQNAFGVGSSVNFAEGGSVVGTAEMKMTVNAWIVKPDIRADFVTTDDSQSLRFGYEILGNIENSSVSFYRSEDEVFDEEDVPILQNVPLQYLTAGVHEQTALLAEGLPIDPTRTYVIAVFDQQNDVVELDELNNSAFFRKIPAAAIVHGFAPSAITSLFFGNPDGTPEWQTALAGRLSELGYEYVLPFDWSAKSILPLPFMTTYAAEDLLETMLAQLGQKADASWGMTEYDVLDVHLIGHSRGVVVISEMLDLLDNYFSSGGVSAAEEKIRSAISRGFKRMTMLDAHPANISWKLPFSVMPSVLGVMALNEYTGFALRMFDPDIKVHSMVDYSEAFLQNTRAWDWSADLHPVERIMNLWGVLPVSGHVNEVCNLTGVMGHVEVPLWYAEHVETLLQPGTCYKATIPPDIPVLIPLPSDSLSPERQPDIAWYPTAGSLNHEIWISDLQAKVRIFHRQGHAASSLTLPHPLPVGRYAVWVRDHYADGSTSQWSAPRVFEVLRTPSIPTVSLQTVQGDSVSPLISWEPVPGASTYSIEIREVGGDLPVVREFTDLNVHLPERGLPDGRFHVSVQAFSGQRPLTTREDLVTFVAAKAPVFTVAKQGMQWSASSESVSHELWISSVSGESRGTVLRRSDLSGTSLEFEEPLSPGRHFIWMRSLLTDGRFSPWSAVEVVEFFHQPIMIAPIRTLETQPRISWAGQASGIYDIYVSRNDNTVPPYQHRTAGNSVELPVLTRGLYTMWVRQNHADGSRSSWGPGTTLEIGERPGLSLTGSALTWTAYAGATQYELWVSSGTSSDRIDVTPKYVSVTTVNVLSLSLSSGSYRVWIRAVSDGSHGLLSTSMWSQPQVFDVAAQNA